MTQKSYSIIHWTARILSIFCIIPIIGLWIGAFTSPPANAQGTSDSHMMGIFVVLIVIFITSIGLVLAWKWEIEGGVLNLAGLFLITVMALIVSPLMLPFIIIFLWPVGIPGLMFIVAGMNRPAVVYGQGMKKYKSLFSTVSDYFRD